MKILHLATHMNIGGISNYILNLSTALKGKGIESVVASNGGDLEGELKKIGIAHIRLNIRTKFELSPKVMMSIIAVKSMVRRERPDIIHAHTRVSQVVASFVSRSAGIPYVTTCHGFFKKRMRGLFDTWGTRVIAISEQVKTHLIKDLGVNEDRIELIYNGIDSSRFLCDYSAQELVRAKAALGLGEGPVIGTIGRLSPVKGQEFLIRAMDDAALKRSNTRCVIVGNGPDENMLKGLARSLGLDDRVYFFRADTDTRKYLTAMDIFVLPSLQEGLGMALLEALASGRPCIASRIGGLTDVIRDGLDGMLVTAGIASDIAAAASKLLGEKDLAIEMGRRGREAVKEKFSLGAMADKTIDLYKRIIEK